MAKLTKKQHSLQDLKQRVLTLDLEPGATLDESTLAESYGLSRTPMREVLQQLAGEGYLSLEAHRGATVSSMDLATMRTFFQTAPMIYASATRLAAENATSAQIDALKSIQAQFSDAVLQDRAGDAVMHNHGFHEAIGHMAANPYLLPSLRRLLIDHTRMSQTFYRPRQTASRKRVESASQHHDAIIAAIEARQPARAVELTLEHWELSRYEIEKYVRPDPLPIDGVDANPEIRRNAV